MRVLSGIRRWANKHACWSNWLPFSGLPSFRQLGSSYNSGHCHLVYNQVVPLYSLWMRFGTIYNFSQTSAKKPKEKKIQFTTSTKSNIFKETSREKYTGNFQVYLLGNLQLNKPECRWSDKRIGSHCLTPGQVKQRWNTQPVKQKGTDNKTPMEQRHHLMPFSIHPIRFSHKISRVFVCSRVICQHCENGVCSHHCAQFLQDNVFQALPSYTLLQPLFAEAKCWK